MGMIGTYLRIAPETLDELLADPAMAEDLLEQLEEDNGKSVDIDKAWHGLHFVLNGTAWEGEGPLFNAVLGGAELSDEEIGYGPARYLTPDQVRATSAALSALSEAEFRRRYNPAAMAEAKVYPQIWDADADEGLEYLLENYRLLAGFFEETARRGDAMLLLIL